MDEYSRSTKTWLDERFRTVDSDGVYVAHQPIYGLNAGHCEPAILEKYVRSHHILRALSQIDFASLLDAGCAEGFHAHLVRTHFHARVRACDLSEHACRRAREIFDVDADVADVHELPYATGAFDVVTCSESLEHVTDPRRVLGEFLRVSRRAVVVTVPHESADVIEHNIDAGEPHGHIHHFDTGSFDFVREIGCQLIVRRIVSPYLRFPAKVVPVRAHDRSPRFPAALVSAYNRCEPLLRRLSGEWVAGSFVRSDKLLCRIARGYNAVLAMILKPGCRVRRQRSIPASRVVSCRVPFHRLELRQTDSEPGA